MTHSVRIRLGAKLVVFSCLLGSLTAPSIAQEIKNVSARFDGEKVIIAYDLLTPKQDDKFAINLYSSHDAYQKPLSLVVGDAGENVSAGSGHRITWDAKSTLPPDFNGELTFKVKAAVMVSLHHPSRLKAKPLDKNVYKRGSVLNLEWNGIKEGELIQVELFQEGQLVERLAEVPNNHVHSWSIPTKTKAGGNYSLRVSKADTPSIYDESALFKVAPKVPLALKLLPVVVIGGVVAIIAATSDDEEPDLPGPVTPGG